MLDGRICAWGSDASAESDGMRRSGVRWEDGGNGANAVEGQRPGDLVLVLALSWIGGYFLTAFQSRCTMSAPHSGTRYRMERRPSRAGPRACWRPECRD